MGKKLAIKGHSTRGKEVIELLEMMGGKNIHKYDGKANAYSYYLFDYAILNDRLSIIEDDDFEIFTLQEFLEKYPYKLNDLVLCDDGLLGVVTKMEWDCKKSDMKYHISFKIPVDNKWYSSKNIKCKFMEAKGKKLAIKGHPTRGKEVIELLEMMGGKNTYGYNGDMESLYFSIYNDSIIYGSDRSFLNDIYVFFTLEEFLEKYPFKVGDKVIDEADGCPGVVCEMKWDEGLSDMKYCVAFGNGIDFGWFANDSINYFKIKKDENLEETQSNQDIDKVVDNLEKTTVKNHKMGSKSKLPSKYYEDKLEEIKSKREYDELRIPLDDDKLATEATIMGKKILPPDGYLVGKITQTDNGMLVEYVEKKPKYPKTYEECKEMQDENMYYGFSALMTLQNLIICRDVYWKIAGEEMGLGKPWEPTSDLVYGITRTCNLICTSNRSGNSQLLEFPTEEMRDAFYENFKKEIEQCKELL